MTQHVSVKRTFASGTIKRYHGTLIEQWSTGLKYRDCLGIDHIVHTDDSAEMTHDVSVVSDAEVAS